jgi:hypothetical protein
VRVDPDRHHCGCLSFDRRGSSGIGRRAYPSWGETTLLASHAARSRESPCGPQNGQQPQRHKTLWSEPARRADSDTGTNGVTTRARLAGRDGIPPAWRNHRRPTTADTHASTAASSLEMPRAIAAQNRTGCSRPPPADGWAKASPAVRTVPQSGAHA